MRYALMLMLAVASLPLGCQKKPQPKVAAKPPASTGRTITRLPEPSPRPEPIPAAKVRPQPKPIALPVAPKPAPAGERTYVVKKGDTLWGIATRELGDGKRWTQIPEINPGLTPQSLKAGQTIKLPPK